MVEDHHTKVNIECQWITEVVLAAPMPVQGPTPQSDNTNSE